MLAKILRGHGGWGQGNTSVVRARVCGKWPPLKKSEELSSWRCGPAGVLGVCNWRIAQAMPTMRMALAPAASLAKGGGQGSTLVVQARVHGKCRLRMFWQGCHHQARGATHRTTYGLNRQMHTGIFAV